MKILLINKYLFQKGGAETYVFRVGEQLEKMGHTVEYFGMDDENRIVGNRLNLYVNDIDFHKKSLSQLTYPFKIIYSAEAKKKLKKILFDFAPDVVHINNFNYQLTPSIIYAVKDYEKKSKRRIKIVYTAHDYQLVCPNHMMHNPVTNVNCEKCAEGKYRDCVKGRCIHKSKMRSVLGMLEGWYYHRRNTYSLIDLTVCPSAFMEKKLNLNPVFSGKTAVLLNFIQPAEKKDIKKDNYCIFFGRYSEEKGLGTLLKVAKKNPDINFVFAGSGPLEEEIKSEGNIKNLGYLNGEKLENAIRAALFSITPSEWYENCPFSVLESIMYKTPVLGANTGGIPELIRENETGVLFESGNEDDLDKKVKYLWNNRDLLENMSENCGKIKFDNAESYCKKLINLYKGDSK